MKAAWIDLRGIDPAMTQAVVEAAIHVGCGAVVSDDAKLLATFPPTVMTILDGAWTGVSPKPPAVGPEQAEKPEKSAKGSNPALVNHNEPWRVLVRVDSPAEVAALHGRSDVVAFVNVTDDRSLRVACTAARECEFTIVDFKDPTKIPLEIVIAAADQSAGTLICTAKDVEEATIIVDVLEKGSEGVCLKPGSPSEVFELVRAFQLDTDDLKLDTFRITSTEHIGLGERVCIDTTTNFEKNEGMLVGSYAHGFILCVSETHPLPYMPTRPFRINAGALHSYVLGAENRTNYLSELGSGSVAMAVTTSGQTRRITVGRIKLESRPLLNINAESSDGTKINLIVQDDWHVRVLGPGDAVLNVTELRPGTEVLGYVLRDKRHVGWPVAEYCVEK